MLYIDTERTFDPSRVAEIAAALYPHLFAPLSRAGDGLVSAVYGLLDATDASDASEAPAPAALRSNDGAATGAGGSGDDDVAMRRGGGGGGGGGTASGDQAATTPATAASSGGGGGGLWGSSRVENTRTLLSMITVHVVDTTAQLTRLLAQMEGWSWSSHHNVRMVVLDSVAAFARRELESLASAGASAAAAATAGGSIARGGSAGGGSVSAPMSTMERVAVLARLSAVLKATAETLKIPVVVTNQASRAAQCRRTQSKSTRWWAGVVECAPFAGRATSIVVLPPGHRLLSRAALQITTTRATTGRGIGGGSRGHDFDEDIDAEALLAACNADSSIETILAPALGVTWAHAVNTRVSAGVGVARSATALQSPCVLPCYPIAGAAAVVSHRR